MRLGSFRWALDALGKRLSIFDAAFAAVTARRLGPDENSTDNFWLIEVIDPICSLHTNGRLC